MTMAKRGITIDALKYITTGFAIITAAFLGLELSFNVYAIELKSTFNFTQTEVELISSAGVLGMGFSLVEVVVTERFGYQIGYLLIWLTSSGSIFLLWMSVIFKDYVIHWSIIAVITFILSASQNAGSSRLTTIAVTKVTPRNSGKMVGAFFASVGFAKVLYGSLLQYVFDNDLKNFFMCTFVLITVLVGTCAVIHRPNGKNTEAEEDEKTRLTSDNNNDILPEKEGSLSTLIRAGNFHLTVWPSAMCYSVAFTLMNNITTIAQSTHIPHPVNIVYLLSVIIILGRFIFGILFDKYSSQSCGLMLILLSSSSLIFGIFLCIVLFGNVSVYILTTVVGIGMSGGITIPCTLLSVNFGRHHFPFLVGCMYCIASVFTLLFQCLIGFVYDMRISTDESCYGPSCYFVSFLVLLSVMILSVFFHVLNLILSRHNSPPKNVA